jgi:hypothetical protein
MRMPPQQSLFACENVAVSRSQTATGYSMRCSFVRRLLHNVGARFPLFEQSVKGTVPR